MAVREPLDLPASPRRRAARIYAGLCDAIRRAGARTFGVLVGRQLVSGGSLVDRELLSRVRGSLLSAFDGQLGKLEGLVVMRAEPTGMTTEQSAGERRLPVRPARRRRPRSGCPVVGVELTSTEPSQVPWYKSQDISSVDDLDATAGQAALDLCARRLPAAPTGQSRRADSLLPNVGGDEPPMSARATAAGVPACRGSRGQRRRIRSRR